MLSSIRKAGSKTIKINKMKAMDYDSSSVWLANTIAKVRTYLDIIQIIAINLHTKNIKNSFWELTFQTYDDLIVIETFKLFDKKNLSMFYLMKKLKEVKPEKDSEIQADFENLNKLVGNTDLEQHRHNQKAHLPIKTNKTLSRFADFSDIIKVLDYSEELIKKYNLWVKGSKYSIDCKSIYTNGHKEVLDYISKIII